MNKKLATERLEGFIAELENKYMGNVLKDYNSFLEGVTHHFFNRENFELFRYFAREGDIILEKGTGTSINYTQSKEYSALSLRAKSGKDNFLIIFKGKDKEPIMHYSDGKAGVEDERVLHATDRYNGFPNIYGWSQDLIMPKDWLTVKLTEEAPLVEPMFLSIKGLVVLKKK